MTSGGAAGSDAEYPSVAISHGDYAAEIALFGGAVKALTYRGAPLVESYEGKPPLMAGVVLAPWPNRTEDGWFEWQGTGHQLEICLLYTSPSPRDRTRSRMPSSA